MSTAHGQNGRPAEVCFGKLRTAVKEIGEPRLVDFEQVFGVRSAGLNECVVRLDQSLQLRIHEEKLRRESSLLPRKVADCKRAPTIPLAVVFGPRVGGQGICRETQGPTRRSG